MTAFRHILCRLLIVLMAWTPFQMAQAGMINPEVGGATSDRSAVLAFLDRADVASQLQSLGIDQATAKERVNAMTDSEVAALQRQIDSLPAGGVSHGAKVLILLIVIGVIVWWVAGRPGM